MQLKNSLLSIGHTEHFISCTINTRSWSFLQKLYACANKFCTNYKILILLSNHVQFIRRIIGMSFTLIGSIFFASTMSFYCFVKVGSAFATRDQLTTTVAECLMKLINNYGIPDNLFTDQGRNFEATIYRQLEVAYQSFAYHLFFQVK